MSKEIEALIKTAFEDLEKVKDPYQHGMLAMAIVEQLKSNPAVTREDLENKPEMKSEKKAEAEAPKAESAKDTGIGAMTPQSEEIAKIANEAAQKSTEEEITVTMAPVQEDTSEKDEAYYDSDEWKNKHLNSSELDATWTDRMKKNGPLMQDAKTLKDFVQYCSSGNMPQGWLDQAVAKVTDNHFTPQDKGMYMPKMVSFVLAGLKKAYYDYQQSANKAA